MSKPEHTLVVIGDESVLSLDEYLKAARIRVIGCVYYLDIEEPINDVGPDKFSLLPANVFLDDDIRLNEKFAISVGDLENQLLKDNSVYQLDFDGRELILESDFDAVSMAEKINIKIHKYFNMLLCHIDNSVFLGKCYLVIGEGDFILFNNRMKMLSNSVGKYSSIKLDSESFKSFDEFYLSFETHSLSAQNSSLPFNSIPVNLDSAGILVSRFNNQDYVQGRLVRSPLLLSLARENSFLPIKITFYIVLLECLFSVEDSTEIAHKISERVAVFIGTTGAEKRLILKELKKAYNVRSKFAHGQKLTDKKRPITYDMQASYSLYLDGVVRKVLTKIYSSDDIANVFKEDEKLREYLNSLLFP